MVPLFSFYEQCPEAVQAQLYGQHFADLTQMLDPNLLLAKDKLRLDTLRVLSLLEKRGLAHQSFDSFGVYQACLLVEETPVGLESIRTKKQRLEALTKASVLACITPAQSVILMRYLVGCFWINFSLIWPEAQAALIVHAKHAPKEFWPIVHEQLVTVANELRVLAPETVCFTVVKKTEEV